MEYMEGPTIHKAVLDNLLGSMGSSAVVKDAAPYSRPSNGYAPLPVPLFHGATVRSPAMVPPITVSMKNAGTSLPLLPGGFQRRDSCTSPPRALFKDCLDPSETGGSALSLSAVKEATPLSAVKEKRKRVRKSRAGATPKKRGISDMVLDANLGGAAHSPPQASPAKRRRPSAKLVGDAEKGEKPPPRKRNRTKAQAKDERAFSSSTNETSFNHSRSDTYLPNGILGLYGLETKAPDLMHYMKDISLEGLLAGDFNMPSLPQKQGPPPPGCAVKSSIGSHVSSILQNLTRSVDQSRQQADLLSKPMESKPLKLSFDLESTPFDDIEESQGGSFFENKSNAPTIFPQSRKTLETASLFSMEAVPVMPQADFWNTLQINSNMSLNSLITQVSANLDTRFPPIEAGSSCNDKLPTTLPPPIFSLGSTQAPQENTCDKLASSKLNHWFGGAGAPKQSLFDALPVPLSQSSKFPFKLDNEKGFVGSGPLNPAEKSTVKEGLFDIDLNKQSLEAEAAEMVPAHSTSITMPRPEVVNVSTNAVQAKIETVSTDKVPSQSEHKGLDLDAMVAVKEAMVPVKEAEIACIVDSVIHGDVVVGHNENQGPISLEDGELAARLSQGSSLLFVNRKDSSEQAKETYMDKVSSLTLSVPDATETEEICPDDVPYSPGMQATAHLLCRMAISSSPFYVEDGDKDERSTHASVSCDDDGSFERSAKVARAVNSVEKNGTAHKCSTPNNKEHKMLAKNVKEKYLYSQMNSNITMLAEKEPWAALTPPRHPPKHVARRVSGSQSSESERSHGLVLPRDHTSNGNHGSMNKTTQRDHKHGVVATFTRASSCFSRKEPKANHTALPKTSLLHALPIKGSRVSTPKKGLVSEAKQFSTPHGEGFGKISRPRSSMSKNSTSQAKQRSANDFPVQPRSLNGCSMKSTTSRHVLPYVGEVRHGSK